MRNFRQNSGDVYLSFESKSHTLSLSHESGCSGGMILVWLHSDFGCRLLEIEASPSEPGLVGSLLRLYDRHSCLCQRFLFLPAYKNIHTHTFHPDKVAGQSYCRTQTLLPAPFFSACNTFSLRLVALLPDVRSHICILIPGTRTCSVHSPYSKQTEITPQYITKTTKSPPCNLKDQKY